MHPSWNSLCRLLVFWPTAVFSQMPFFLKAAELSFHFIPNSTSFEQIFIFFSLSA